MNKKDKISPTAPAAAAAASGVQNTRPTSVSSTKTSTTTATSKPSTKKMVSKDIPSNNHPKAHPKTLDIPGTPSKSAPTVVTNGAATTTTVPTTTPPSIKTDKKAAVVVPPSLPAAPATGTTTTSNNKIVTDSPRRVVAVAGPPDNGATPKENQKSISPSSSISSSSPSSSTSGILPSQFATICREVAQVREEHLFIRKSLTEREGELGKTRVALRNIAQERDVLRGKVSELEKMLKRSPEMYSHVATILSSGNDPLLSGNHLSSAALQFDFQSSSSSSSPSTSSKHSPEEVYTSLRTQGRTNSQGHYAPFPGLISSNNVTSSPTRNMVRQQLPQNQKLVLLPSSSSSTAAFQSHPDMVPGAVAAGGTIGSPRRNNGNEGNLNRKASFLGGTEETLQVGGSGGRSGGGNVVLPCSPRSSSPDNVDGGGNINSQESHQASHNNKNLHHHQHQHHQQQQHKHQHSMQQQHYSKSSHHMKHATYTIPAADKNKSIYCGQEHGPRATPPPSLPPQPSLSKSYLEYHNGNGRSNVNGNDRPVMTNSNNNNNHCKSPAVGGGITRGGGSGHNHLSPPDYHHQHQYHLSQSGITGLDLMLLGPDCSTKVVEHLVHPVSIESSVREIQHTMVLKGVPLNGDRLREVEIEIDRLNSRIDHLRSQNDVLTLNLEDAKSHADRLTVLLGKYESNNVALQMALRYSDQMSSAYEVLAALLETELGQVVTSIHAAGQLHLICAPPQPSGLSGATSGAVVVSRSGVTSSGNNNNSNDNSPSEHVPPLSSSSSSSQKQGEDEQRNKQPGNNNNGTTSAHENVVGGDNKPDSPDNNNGATTAITSPVECGGKTTVSGTNRGLDTAVAPTSSSSSTTPTPSSAGLTTKAMNLVEHARRNRLAAEQAARFLLSRFSSASMHHSSNGVVISPTGSDNNNERGGGPGSSTFLLRPTCQSNSTTSINSVTSNLSNASGDGDGGARQDSISLSSPDEKNGGKRAEKLPHDEETGKPSPAITGVTDGKEVSVNGENIKSSPSAVTGTSPTSSSTTFRAPYSPNGNGPLTGGATSIITSILPLLRNAAAAQQQQNNPSNGCSPEAISAAVEPSIRHLISTLKAERDAVKQTVMELESESLESLTPSPKPSSPYYSNGINNNNRSSNATPTASWSPAADARKLDLETAVLMQELMSMKEERAELRAQLFLVEKEKSSLQLRLRSHESQEEAYRARINYLKSEIMDTKSLHSATTTATTVDTYNQDRNRNDILKAQQQQQQQQKNNGNNRNLETIINNNNNNQNVDWEREALLKKRIHELASTLEKVTVSSQVREKQNQEMINELNRANGILMQTLDVAKKKYQNRVKKMEDQVLYISERHAAQLKLFGEKMPAGGGKYHL